MDRENSGEVPGIKREVENLNETVGGSPIESKLLKRLEPKMNESFLRKWANDFNERFKKSNDRESLVKGIAKLEGVAPEQVEEKVREESDLRTQRIEKQIDEQPKSKIWTICSCHARCAA